MKINASFPASLMALLLASIGSAAFAQAPAKVSEGVLTDANGMTLYTFDKDVEGKSACYSTCAANWPAFSAQDSDKAGGDYGIINRDDGKKQWTIKGKALYLWAKDKKPGDRTGDGVNGTWHVAKP